MANSGINTAPQEKDKAASCGLRKCKKCDSNLTFIKSQQVYVCKKWACEDENYKTYLEWSTQRHYNVVKKYDENMFLLKKYGTSKVSLLVKKIEALRKAFRAGVLNLSTINAIEEGRTYEAYIRRD